MKKISAVPWTFTFLCFHIPYMVAFQAILVITDVRVLFYNNSFAHGNSNNMHPPVGLENPHLSKIVPQTDLEYKR